jgi:hypothetical protein
MAKNKNRKQGGRQERPSRAGAQQVKSSVTEAGVQSQTQGGPTDVVRGKQRRFGHN